MTKAQQTYKKNLIQKIQIVKHNVFSDDEMRKEFMLSRFGVDSTTKLSIDELKLLLDFSLSDYWQKHYTFNTISKQSSKKISSGFINHLFINAIVPFVFFYQKMKNNNETTIALDYLDSIPIEKNSIIERWKSIIVISNNACSSQALLHLYKNYCKQKKCLQCNLGKKLLLKQDATN